MKKLTLGNIESNIVNEWYIHVPGGTMTICVLTTKSGFQVTGESACINPADFNTELGKQHAKGMALDKLWPLMGYQLKEENFVSKTAKLH